MNSKTLISIPLSLILASSIAAQERLVPKQLSGPIEEARGGVMAEVDPIETSIQSKSAMIPVDLRPDKSGDWRWHGKVPVDGNNVSLVLFAGEDSWDLNVAQANSKSLAPATRLADELERTSLAMGSDSLEGDYYRFFRAQPGEWSVAIEAAAPHQHKGYLLYSSDSAYRLLSYKSTTDQLVGRNISFVTYGYGKTAEGLQNRPSQGLVEQAQLQVTTPAGELQEHAMFDDGLHGDSEAGDGIFGGSFRAQMAGDYQAQVVAEGTTPEGFPFLRTVQHVVPVVAAQVELIQDFASARVVDDGHLTISLAVDNKIDAPEKYRVFAEIWGADALGVMQPINWIGGMSYVDDGQLSLGLDLRWIGRSKARSSFELRNVRIEDPDTFIPVARVNSLSVAMPKLPVVASAASAASDEQMLMGPRPEALKRQAANKAGSRLLLVHGYCSGNVWGPLSGQFSNDSVFLDIEQNRSHDQFANLIGSFGSSYSSYGIVAHSQGGAAALHLYTYYWSGLDNATGGRLIQSVGTPYQGTALAGNAAVLGQIFGVGCGSNSDLTYSGASSWLAGIPTWARNKVNYYTTSFTDKWWRFDYCNIVTDLLLGDPEDGTTERSKGQLPSGVNRGHKTGWCHTSGMRDPAQTTDSSRNASMNSNAAN